MKLKKLSKNKKRKIRQFNQKMGCLFFSLLMLLSLATPAFAEVNVDGGSSAVSGSATGKGSYNNSDQAWKVTVFYARYDTTNKKTTSLANTKQWRKYGDSIYVYHPTAVRGASGKINLTSFKNALFVYGNKAEYLYNSSSNIANQKPVFATYSNTSHIHFYADTSSPAVAMNGYTIDDVREYFKEPTTLQKMIKEITKWKKGSWSTANFYSLLDSGNNAFNIDGVNKVNKTSNSGKAVNGYSWSSSTYLNGSDWFYGVKTDYNSKRIYMYPTASGDTNLNATAWMILYEPVLLVEPNTYPIINRTSYQYVACTPTEFAMLDYHLTESQFSISTLKKTIYNLLSNSTYLDETWSGISARSSAFAYNTDVSRIFKEAGVGMAYAAPYNYVIRDYAIDISMPKSVKVGESFTVTYKAVNNTSNAKSGVPVVFAGIVKDGGVYYLYDMFAMNKKSLTKDNAIATATSSSGVYNTIAQNVESLRESKSGKPKMSPPANDKSGVEWSGTYTLSSDFSSSAILEIRATINDLGSESYVNAKKELNSGAYYKSGQDSNWGNNYDKAQASVVAAVEASPKINIQLVNNTSNEDLDLSGKRFAVWCVGISAIRY